MPPVTTPPSPAPSGLEVVHETLPSGLTLIAEPWGPAPVVAVQVFVAAGASSDPRTASGAAHLLEHMVFKGAGAHAGPALTEAVEALGGDLNAWTSIDETCFHVTVPAAAFEVATRMLGQLVLRPWLRGEDLEPEQGVVVEEIRGAEDDPTGVLADRARAAMWGTHPGARRVLGSADSVRGMDIEALRAFHCQQYHPERLALVVAGPVGIDRIRAVARELDAWVPTPGPLPPALPPVPSVRPAVPGPIVVCDGHEERHIEITFPTPDPAHPDIAALDLLTVMLGDGGGSRLLRVLRDEEAVAVTAWAAMETEQAGGMTSVGATPREGGELDALRLLGRVVAETRTTPPEPAELARARGVVRSDVLRERETVDGRAHRLGWYWHRFDDLTAEASYMTAIEKVSADDVQRVARTWLRPERALIGVATADKQLDAARLQAAWDEGSRGAASTSRPPAPQLVQRVLPGGLRVVVQPEPRAEMVGLSIIGVGGVIAEPARRAGLASAWARMLTRGAGALTRGQVAHLVEARSGATSVWAARNSVGIELAWPAGGEAWLAWVLQEMLLAPRFDVGELEKVLDDLRIDCALAHDDPSSLAWDGVFADLYRGHAWARPVEGTAGGLNRVDVPALYRYHDRVTTAENLHVAVSGPVDPDEVFALLAPLSRGLPEGPAIAVRPPHFRSPVAGASRRRLVPRADAQAQVALGVADPQLGVLGADEAAVRVLEAVLGGARGGGGRLFQRIREELGLAYSVGASWEGGLGAGALLVHAGTDPERCGDVATALWECCVQVGRDGVSAEELDRVHSGLVDGAHQDLQRSVSRARHLAAASVYRGDAALWKAALELPTSASADAVSALARRLFDPTRRVEVRAGPRGRW